MIEIIYKEEQKKAEGNESFFKVPNNIRQIGEIKGFQKIYIEDYAYTFLKKISRNGEKGGKAAILFGQYHWQEGNSYLFIKSALQVNEMEVSQDHVVFTDKEWGQIYEDSKKYFPDQEIVGWFVSLPGFNMQINEVLLKTHLNHFSGNDKALFIMEPGEWEEAFFVYENNQLVRQSGYYIYYEKNECMQSYMIEMSKNKSIEDTEKVPDRAVVDFRKAVKEKNEAEQEKVQGKKSGHWIVGTCAAAAMLAIGITFYQNSRNMEWALDSGLSGNVTEKEEAQTVSADSVETNPSPTVEEKPDFQVTREAQKEGTEEKTETEQKDIREETVPGSTEPVQEAVPTAKPVMQDYVIQKGDTMTSICKNKYGTIARLEEICRLNGITPEDIIYAGEKIKLPD